MAWKVTQVVDERIRFVLEDRSGNMDFAALCRKYGVSRKTGYKWRRRYGENRDQGALADRRRTPKSSPLATTPEMALEVVRLRVAHPTWGPVKLRVLLARAHAAPEIPSERTIARILDQTGLVEVRRRVRGRAPGRIKQAIVPAQPNDLWTIDFKGWWRTRDQHKCEPLTVRDDWSRFFLAAQAMTSTRGELVKEVMTDLFRRFGLPRVIRSDNGSPFASSAGYLGLTKLSVWWLALGIGLYRIEPGHPEQNGSHERPHADMKREVQWRPSENLGQQQGALDLWRHEFNHIRPHQALGLKTPAEFYTPSPRPFPEGKLVVTYPAGFEVRRVSQVGFVKLKGQQLFVSEALKGWDVGIQHVDGMYRVWFAEICLGETNSWAERLQPVKTQPVTHVLA